MTPVEREGMILGNENAQFDGDMEYECSGQMCAITAAHVGRPRPMCVVDAAPTMTFHDERDGGARDALLLAVTHSITF